MSFFKSPTGGSLFGGSPNYGTKAANAETARQMRIDEGLALINAVFGGGTAPLYSQAKYFNPSQNYYMQGKKGDWQQFYGTSKGPKSLMDQTNTGLKAGFRNDLFTGTPGLGAAIFGTAAFTKGLFGGGNQKSPEEMTANRINKGMLFTKEDKTFEGFQPSFYDQRAQAYENYALPQLAEQYRQARNQIGFGLANRGLAGSGAANQAWSDLFRQNAIQKQGIADTGRSQAQALQKQVEESRQNLINQLYQTADPAGATQDAISTAASLRQPSFYAPLTNSFSNLLNQYYASALLNPKQGGGFLGGGYDNPQTTFSLPSNYSVG